MAFEVKLKSAIVIKWQMALTVVLLFCLTITQVYGFSLGYIQLFPFRVNPGQVIRYFTSLLSRYLELGVFFVLFKGVRNKSLPIIRTFCWTHNGIYILQTLVFAVNAAFFPKNSSTPEPDSTSPLRNMIFGWISWIPLSVDLLCLPIHIMELEIPAGKERRSWTRFQSIPFKRIIWIQSPIYLLPMFLYTFLYGYKILLWFMEPNYKSEDYYLLGLYTFKGMLGFGLIPMVAILHQGLKRGDITRIILFYRLHLLFMYFFGVAGGVGRVVENSSNQVFHNSKNVIILSLIISLHLSYHLSCHLSLSIFLVEFIIQLRVNNCLSESGEEEGRESCHKAIISQNPSLFQRITLPEKQIQLGPNHKLGEGQFSEVFKALKFSSRKYLSCRLSQRQFGGEVVAVKILKQDGSRTYSEALMKELKILDGVGQHPNLIKFYGCCFWSEDLNQESVIGIVLEYCNLGSLQSYLTFLSNLETEKVDIFELIRISKETAQGMSYLEEKKIVHADLAARNVLLTSDKLVKITDFGMSLKLYYYQVYVTSTGDLFPWKSMAPEALTDLRFSSKSDVWSYGVLLFEIFSLGNDPFPYHVWTSQFVQELMDGLRPLKPRLGGDTVFKIMSQCWNWDPRRRPEFKELIMLLDRLNTNTYQNV